MKNGLTTVLAAITLSASAPIAAAETFPTHPVRYILPFPAGDVMDTITRRVSSHLGERWGQPVIVENRPGAGTIIGTEAASKSAPDGYTLLQVVPAHAINPTLYARLPYDTLKDFSCVTEIGVVYVVLIAHPSLPAKTVAELIALAKAQPGKIFYASPGTGTSLHISGEALRQAAGIDIAHVPYKGVMPAMQDLLPGRVPLFFAPVHEALQYIQSGKVVPIAIAGPKRSPALPDIPTIGETLPGYSAGASFWALLTRGGTPPAVLKKLNADVLDAMRTADVREQMAQLDIEPVLSSPEQCDAFLREQTVLWGGAVRASGAKVD